MSDLGIFSFPLEEPLLDYDWVTDRLAVGGAIWTRRNMDLLADAGITHVLNLQREFDDSKLADGTGISVFWNPCDDDLLDKPPELFHRGVEYAASAYEDPRSRIYFHCSAGVHRGPMMLLAFLGCQGMKLAEAMELIQARRPQADFPEVYLESVAQFLVQCRREKD